MSHAGWDMLVRYRPGGGVHERTYIAPGGKTRLTSIKRVQEYCVLRGIPIPLPTGESSGDEGEV